MKLIVCHLIATKTLILVQNSMKGLRGTRSIKEIKFEVVWDELDKTRVCKENKTQSI